MWTGPQWAGPLAAPESTLTLQPLLFLEKARETAQKSKGFSLRGTPKILGKERKNAQKSKGNRKTKKARNSKKARIGGSGQLQCWPNRPQGGEGGADLGVGSGGSVPHKPLTTWRVVWVQFHCRLDSLSFLSLFFWNSLFFPLFWNSLFFFCAFPFFSRDFRGLVGKKSLFFGCFPCPFQKRKQGKEEQGWAKRTEIAAIFAICDCDAHRGPQKWLAISETLRCDLRAICDFDLRYFWGRKPFFLRAFWRFGSVNAEIASDCDCAICGALSGWSASSKPTRICTAPFE